MHKLFLAKGALATTAIEGNTLSEQEVLGHIERRLKLPPSKEYLGQEIDHDTKAPHPRIANTFCSDYVSG
jgi:hypothetical protein